MLYPIETIFSYINTLQSSQLYNPSLPSFIPLNTALSPYSKQYSFITTHITSPNSHNSNPFYPTNQPLPILKLFNSTQFTIFNSLPSHIQPSLPKLIEPILTHSTQFTPTIHIISTYFKHLLPITTLPTNFNQLKSTTLMLSSLHQFPVTLTALTYQPILKYQSQLFTLYLLINQHSINSPITQSTHTILTNNHFIQQFIFNTSHIHNLILNTSHSHNLIQRLRTNH